DAPTRKALAHNLADEEGILQGESHPELWLSFGQGLGLTKESIQEASPRPSAQQVVRTFFDFARSSYAEGLGALFAYEHQIPPIAESKIKGLREFYGIESKET